MSILRWRKDNELWLFLILLSVPPGSARAAVVNADEVVVGMAPGDAGKYLTGILAVMILLWAAGKRTIR